MSSQQIYDDISKQITGLTLVDVQNRSANYTNIRKLIATADATVQNTINRKMKERSLLYSILIKSVIPASQQKRALKCLLKSALSPEQIQKAFYQYESDYDFSSSEIYSLVDKIACSKTEDLQALANYLEKWNALYLAQQK